MASSYSSFPPILPHYPSTCVRMYAVSSPETDPGMNHPVKLDSANIYRVWGKKFGYPLTYFPSFFFYHLPQNGCSIHTLIAVLYHFCIYPRRFCGYCVCQFLFLLPSLMCLDKGVSIFHSSDQQLDSRDSWQSNSLGHSYAREKAVHIFIRLINE